MSRTGLALGFVSPSKPWHLISPLFPDKIGGRPAWLALQHLPHPAELLCKSCSQPMVFLLQVYSTVDDRTDCFHRFLFLFMCRNGQCHQAESAHPFVAFRSQLARENPYYSYDPPETEEPTLSTVQSLIGSNKLPCAEQFNTICPVCGCMADKVCSKCKAVKYCSKAHQVLHWKQEHKAMCNPDTTVHVRGPSFSSNDFLLPEYKLCSEMAEESLSDSHNESSEDSGSEEQEDPNSENAILESLAKRETEAEARFRRFREAMSVEPDQVIRLHRGGQPWWLSESPPFVPNCEVCGAERQFEFQVTPQLLHHLKLDRLGEASPDFGSLYVFTCSDSCSLPRTVTREDGTSEIIEYQPEVVIRQMVP